MLTDHINLEISSIKKPILTSAQPSRIKTISKTLFVKYPEFNRPVLTSVVGSTLKVIANRVTNVQKLRQGKLSMISRLEAFQESYFCEGSHELLKRW